MTDKIKILYLLIFIQISCYSTIKKNQENQVWENFVSKMEDKDMEYLIQNSRDSIFCVDCLENHSQEIHSSELIFDKYLDKLYNKNYLRDRNYGVFQDSIIIRISYSDDKNIFSQERSTTVYMFDLYEGVYKFSGMITIP